MTFDEVCKTVEEYCGTDRDSDEFRAAVVLLSSLEVGPNVNAIYKFTRYRRSFVGMVAYRLERAGIWKKGKVYGDWLDKETGGISFVMDCCVAAGLMART